MAKIIVPSLSTLILVLTPLVFLPLPFCVPGQEAICAYILFVVMVYWATDCISMGITGMVPVVLYSATGILNLAQITRAFFFPGLWLFIGSLMMAIAVQSTKFHERVALKILLVVGTKPRRLLFGFMLTSHILSMFIANVAVTAMMLPIAEGVFREIKRQSTNPQTNKPQLAGTTESCNETGLSIEKGEEEEFVETSVQNENQEEIPESKEMKKFKTAVTLCIPYVCKTAGTSTIPASALNVVMIDIIKTLFPRSEVISYGTWFFFCAPASIVIMLLSYIWMAWLHLGFRKKKGSTEIDSEAARRLLQCRYDELGPVVWAQAWVIFLFATNFVLWFTRNPGFFPGWGSLFPNEYVNDGVVAMTTSLLLFVIPRNKPVIFGHRDNGLKVKEPKILSWKEFEEKFTWEVIFLAGGGMTIAKGTVESGLSAWLSTQILNLGSLQPWLVVLLITCMASLLTECLSNLAMMAIFLPVLAQMAHFMQVHPYYLFFPLTLAGNLAFMLPVSSATNALAYMTGNFKIKDMIKTGWMLNLIGIFVINLSINTYGKAVLGLDQYPDWASTNLTGPKAAL